MSKNEKQIKKILKNLNNNKKNKIKYGLFDYSSLKNKALNLSNKEISNIWKEVSKKRKNELR